MALIRTNASAGLPSTLTFKGQTEGGNLAYGFSIPVAILENYTTISANQSCSYNGTSTADASKGTIGTTPVNISSLDPEVFTNGLIFLNLGAHQYRDNTEVTLSK